MNVLKCKSCTISFIPKIKWSFLLLFLLCTVPNVKGQKLSKENLDRLAQEYTKKSLPMLKELLSIPNDANYPKDIEKNVAWCEKAFTKRNFTTTRLGTSTVPLLLAERKVNNPKKTVLVYLQLDGQPVDENSWSQNNPYEPVLKKQDVNGEWVELNWNEIKNYEDD